MRGSDYAQLRAFAAVVEHGAFKRAAAHLGMSASALSRVIQQLEDRLKVRLLNRTTRSVAPTEAGERLIARLRPILADLDATVAEVIRDDEKPSGVLRINATRLACIHYLAPRLAHFMEAYPDISLDIAVEERLIDIVSQGFDAGVRLGERLEKDMVAVKLGGHIQMMVVAAPSYLQRFGIPRTPRDLAEHRCLQYRRPTDDSVYRWEFERDGKSLEAAVDGPLIVSDPECLVRLAVDGAGVAYLFEHQVRDRVAEGGLVHLLAEWSPPFPGFYLYYPRSRRMAPALRAFIDAVAK